MPKTYVLGIDYENVTLAKATEDVLKMAKLKDGRYIVTPNPEISEGCRVDPKLGEAVSQADYIVPDGIGVVMAAKILGRPLQERVGGYDLACSLLPRMEKDKLSLFLLGAKPGVAELAAANLRQKYPQLNICGTNDGYFKDDEMVINKVKAASPDFVFVALGSPRQEIWMHQYAKDTHAGVLMGLGGSLDIFAGVAKRAPGIFIKLNIEWFYRLLRQPRRFVRMLKLPKYLFRAVFTRLFHMHKEDRQK